jgi:hypothetical protein
MSPCLGQEGNKLPNCRCCLVGFSRLKAKLRSSLCLLCGPALKAVTSQEIAGVIKGKKATASGVRATGWKSMRLSPQAA